MTDTRPSTGTAYLYGSTGSPQYATAPLPGGGGYDPYSAPGAFDPATAQAGQASHGAVDPGSGYLGLGGGQGSGYTPPVPSPRRSGSRALLVVGVVLALVLGLGALSYFVWPAWGQGDPGASPTDGAAPTADPTTDPAAPDPTTDPVTMDPTSDPSTQPTDPPSTDTQQPDPVSAEITADGRLDGPGYSFVVPAAWTLSPESGSGDDGSIVDGQGSDITVYVMQQGVDYCQADAEVLQIWVPGELTALPDREIGGLPATGNRLVGDAGDYYELYCVDVDGVAYEVSLQTTTALEPQVQPLFEDALGTWTWE